MNQDIKNILAIVDHTLLGQGATWNERMPADFRVAYPLTAGEYIEVSKREVEGYFIGSFAHMAPETTGSDMFEQIFAEAVSIAESRNVPLYCGEYGVIHNANPHHGLSWQKDIHTAFEKNNIGRAVWNYKRMGFGIVDEHNKEVYEELIKYL